MPDMFRDIQRQIGLLVDMIPNDKHSKEILEIKSRIEKELEEREKALAEHEANFMESMEEDDDENHESDDSEDNPED